MSAPAGPAGPTTGPDVGPRERVARNAGVIGGLTVLSRVAGFGRTAVLGWTTVRARVINPGPDGRGHIRPAFSARRLTSS